MLMISQGGLCNLDSFSLCLAAGKPRAGNWTSFSWRGGGLGGGRVAGFLDIHVSSTITSCFFVVFQPLLMTE